MITFAGPSGRDSTSPQSQTARLINLWREPVATGGRTQHLLRAAAGMELEANIGGTFVRDMFSFDDSVIALSAGQLSKISPDGVFPFGTVASGLTGQISRNGSSVTVTSGGRYYVWDSVSVSLTEVTSGPFSSFGSVAYLAGRTLLSQENGALWCWSDIADPGTLPGLNFATAESRDDKLLRIIVANGVAMLFGERSTEIWAPSGSGANAFAMIGGSVVDRGLKAFGLAVAVEGGVFCVGNDGIAYLVSGNQWQAISTPAVNSAIAEGAANRCFYWEQRGHKFAAIGFNDRPTWVYDITTGEWWERAEGPAKRPWRATGSARMGNVWLVGAVDGGIYRLTGAVTDDGAELYREAVSFPVYQGGKPFTIAEIEFLCHHGFQSADLNVMLSIGDGVNFAPGEVKSFGAAGAFLNRAVFRAKGRHVTACARLSITDPVDAPIYADANVRLA